jgi:hypothetical protein
MGRARSRLTLMSFAGVAAISAGLLGCSRKEEAPPAATSAPPAAGDTADRLAQSARETAEQARDSFSRAWDNVKDATYDQRTQAQTSLNQLAISVDAKVSELQARGAAATETTKAKWNDGLAKLRSARTDLEGEIRDLGDATAESWEGAKAEVARAWERVRKAFADLESQPTAM